jgi:hypothetical protein
MGARLEGCRTCRIATHTAATCPLEGVVPSPLLPVHSPPRSTAPDVVTTSSSSLLVAPVPPRPLAHSVELVGAAAVTNSSSDSTADLATERSHSNTSLSLYSLTSTLPSTEPSVLNFPDTAESTDPTELPLPARRNFTAAPGPGTPREGTTPFDARCPTPEQTTPVFRQPGAPPGGGACGGDVADALPAGAGAESFNPVLPSSSPPPPLSSSAPPILLDTSDVTHHAPKLVFAAHRGESQNLSLSYRWLVDFGATATIVSTPALLERVDLTFPSIAIKTMDGTIVRSAAAGPCSIRVIDPRTRVSRSIILRLAYYVPGAAFNLFAVQAAQAHGLAIHFVNLVDGYYGSVRQGDTFDDVLCLIQNVGGALCLTCSTFPPPSVS